MNNVFNLRAREHRSRVLTEWLQATPGAAERAGVAAPKAQAENSLVEGLTANDLLRLYDAGATSSGQVVNPDTAMRVSAVYACVSLIAGAIMTLPLETYQREWTDEGVVRRPAKHDYWWMLNEQANADIAAATGWEYLVSARLFYGDGYAELLRPSPSSNRCIGWLPHHPLRVQPFRDKRADNRLLYRIYPEGGPMYVRDAADMIHVPSLGFDGLTSPSPITYAAREAIGASIAAERYTGQFFNGGAQFSYALSTEASLNEEQYKAQIKRLISRSNTRVPLVLHGGLKPAQLTINSKDAEILATRLFSVEEICRILGVPPFMVGHSEKTTSWGSGIEQLSIAFVRYTLGRHLTAIAQEFNRKLWPSRERYFVEHDTTALERGDLKSRSEAHRIALGRAGEPGWVTPNQVRRAEKMPPIKGGDTLNTGQPAEGGAGDGDSDPKPTRDPDADPRQPRQPQRDAA